MRLSRTSENHLIPAILDSSLRNGYGYRDTVQDIQGIIHLAPEMAKEQIIFMLSAQVDNGAGLPLVKYTHNPGHEDTPDDPSYVKETGHPAYRADDALWLFPTVYKYITESGDVALLDQVVPYANRDKGTVYDHLKRAIDFSVNHMGAHGMPAGLYADWNDCLRLGKETIERVFADAKEKHGMRYTRYTGLAQVTNWVKLKFAAMNLKSSPLGSGRMPTTFCKSSYFGHNMLKTPVLPDAKLGFLDGLSPEKFKLLRAVKMWYSSARSHMGQQTDTTRRLFHLFRQRKCPLS